MAPAHPHATSVAVYPALFSLMDEKPNNDTLNVFASVGEQQL